MSLSVNYKLSVEIVIHYASHACRVFSLPDHHNDPFDRLLIAQCLVEDMAFISADGSILEYRVKVIR